MSTSAAAFTSELLQSRPYRHSSGVGAALAIAERHLTGFGFACRVVTFGAAPQLVATRRYGGSARHAVLHGHVAVDPAGPAEDGATAADDTAPGRFRAGRVYGAGVNHMIGGVGTILAVAEALGHRDDLRGHVSVLLTGGGQGVGEETRELLVELGAPPPTLAVLAKATDRHVCTTAYGFASYTVDVAGVPGPMTSAARLDNAVTVAATAVLGLENANEELQGLYPTRQGVRYILPGRIQAGEEATAPATEGSVDFSVASPPLMPPDQAISTVRTQLRQRLTPASYAPPALRSGSQFPPVSLGHEAFADLLRTVNPELGWRQFAFPSDAHVFQDVGTPVVLYGPGRIDRATRPGEYIEIAELDEATATLTAALTRWLTEGGD